MEDIITSFKHEYEVKFIIDNSKDFARLNEIGVGKYERVFVVIDEVIDKLYGSAIFSILKQDGNDIIVHTVSAVESSKSLSYYPKLVSFFEEHVAGRYDAVVAVGGGIILDLVSFTVSTYMRGLPLFMIPTTLIGQTDASTAGKTCLNSTESKNLLGTFYYPKVVYNSIELMRGSPMRITRQGLSEAFKYSLLTDGELIPSIIQFQNSEYSPVLMEKIVRKTIESRIAVRKVDPLASNLGHTFGHALEKYFDYQILHGDAILTGTVMAINYGVEKGLLPEEECNNILSYMKEAHLNIYIPNNLDTHKLVSYMRKDKKSSSSSLHLVMIEGIGKPYVDMNKIPFYSADYSDVESFLNRFSEFSIYKKKDYIDYLKKDYLY